jgi:hypothetical protein
MRFNGENREKYNKNHSELHFHFQVVCFDGCAGAESYTLKFLMLQSFGRPSMQILCIRAVICRKLQRLLPGYILLN